MHDSILQNPEGRIIIYDDNFRTSHPPSVIAGYGVFFNGVHIVDI